MCLKGKLRLGIRHSGLLERKKDLVVLPGGEETAGFSLMAVTVSRKAFAGIRSLGSISNVVIWFCFWHRFALGDFAVLACTFPVFNLQ